VRTNGGNVPAAIAIGREVRRLGLDTFLGRGGECSSACPLILLSGRHVIVQQYSILTFHAANVPEATLMMEEGNPQPISWRKGLALTQRRPLVRFSRLAAVG
jgi:hypothetical protein